MSVPYRLNTAPLSEAVIEKYRASLRGSLILPDGDAYDEARKVWNGFIDRRPALVVYAAGVSDVQQSVRFAREHNLPLGVRGGGHSHPGLSVADGGLLLDLSRLKGIRVDPTRQRVRAEPGVLWRELDHETQGFGLAVTGSQVSSVGIAGLTLGGGLGWLMRKYGLTCDSLLSADVVNADGRLLTASAEENPDLLWGLRGGGGNFGVVTSFEYQLHPVAGVFGGVIAFPLSAAKAVVRGYRDFVASAPDELTTTVAFMTTPDGKRAIGIALGYVGNPQTGEQVIQPLRRLGPVLREQLGPMSYTALQSMMDQTTPPGSRLNVRANFMDDLDDSLIDTLADHYGRSPSPRSSIVILQMGGAVSRVDPQATAFYYRKAGYSLNLFSVWSDPTDDDKNIAWLHGVWEAIQPFLGEGVYVNVVFDEGPARVRAAYGPAYDRLVGLKQKYDPDNLFRSNQNIR